MPDPEVTPDAPRRPERASFLFRLAGWSAFAFIVTIFMCIAAMLGDPNHPGARFIEAYGSPLLIGEAVLTFVLGIVAMTADRRKTLREDEGRGPKAEDRPQAASDAE